MQVIVSVEFIRRQDQPAQALPGKPARFFALFRRLSESVRAARC